MAKNLNVVVVEGNLTRDPEVRSLKSGTAVCDLGLAINDDYIDRDGEWVERCAFLDVIVWGKQGELCGEYLKKGQRVTVKGKLVMESWENNEGERRTKVKIEAEPFGVFFPPKSSGGGSGGGSESRGGGRNGKASTRSGGKSARSPARDDFDEFAEDGDAPWD